MRNCAIIAQFYFAILFVLILPLDGSHSKGTEINSHVCSDKLQGLFQYDYVMRTTIQKAMAESDDLMVRHVNLSFKQLNTIEFFIY